MKHVIIGNGIAGCQGAETIRSLDTDSPITMIAGETFPPYCRPMISLLLEGAVSSDQIRIRPADFYESLGIEPVIGQRATAVDITKRTVMTDTGSAFDFDRLLIATGADPRGVKAEGIELDGIFHMRTEAHVRRILDALPVSKDALALGGGLVAFKAAYALLKRGLRVTMLIGSSHPLSMQVDAVAGELILKELRDNGLRVETGMEVAAFEGNGRVREAHLSDGRRLPCELVVIGKGVRPATSFLNAAEIATDLGIVVDERLQTTVPGIFAAGDVAESVDIARKQRWVNALWPVAVEQGRIAGMNMAGREVSYKGSLSRNVIRIFNTDILVGGLVNPPEGSGYETFARHDRRRNTYRKMVFRDGKLVGLVMINSIEQGGVLLSLIREEIALNLDREQLLEPSFDYSKLLSDTGSQARR